MENENKLQDAEKFYTPSSSAGGQNGGGLKVIIFIIIGIVVLAAVAFGASKILHVNLPFINEGEKNEEIDLSPTPTEKITPTDTPTPTPEETPSPSLKPSPTTKTIPTATPKPTISGSPIDKTTGLDRSKLTVSVLNGSGTSGAAKKAADALTSLGYQVTSTGNADNYNYQNTTIEVKSDKKDYLPLLKNDLSGVYTIGTTSATLSTTTSSDAQVTVGKE